MNSVIIPSLLCYSKDEFLFKLKAVEGLASRLQIDVVGEAFAAQTTIGLEKLMNVGFSQVFDIQLMVEEPETYLSSCDALGVDRVFGHVEFMKKPGDFIEHALMLSMQAGLGLDLTTEIGLLEKYIHDLDAVLLMSVPAGKSGLEFSDQAVEKIRKVRQLRPDLTICVDGGINDKNIGACFAAGANEFVVGNYLWKSDNISKAIHKLQEVLGEEDKKETD